MAVEYRLIGNRKVYNSSFFLSWAIKAIFNWKTPFSKK
ncbi:hypothetical protein B4099_0170 [Heyndrickxia coagulans]|uniref:Uncharacterized protein n=1 Tax=Heyndrickxia coagulans TaxID=1398 RepID=A0A150K560_HEYCO|nr:hypothetical protein B4099_0170 [Heyndrickxia coagulans]